MRRLSRWFGVPSTFYFVCIGWVFFRAPSTQAAVDTLTVDTLRGFVLFSSEGTRTLPAGFVPVLLLKLHSASRWLEVEKLWRGLPAPLFSLACGVLFALMLPFVAAGAEPFIYFQF